MGFLFGATLKTSLKQQYEREHYRKFKNTSSIAKTVHQNYVDIQRGVELETVINEAFNHEKISPVVRLKLPFPVQQDFEDPYRVGLLGYELSAYPHEKDPRRFFYVFSVGLKDASIPRKKAAPAFQQRAWGANRAANNPANANP